MAVKKYPVRKKLIFLFFLLYITGSALNEVTAQDFSLYDNTIYSTYGTAIFINQISIAYERSIYSRRRKSLRLKAHAGKFLSYGLDLSTGEKKYKNYIGISGVFLIELFEMNVGVVHSKYTIARGFEPEPDVDYSEIKIGPRLYSAAGIRYTNERFMLRAGFSNVELLYVGLGVNF